MKEFTHDEKVALLREFDEGLFDKAWQELQHAFHSTKHSQDGWVRNLPKILAKYGLTEDQFMVYQNANCAFSEWCESYGLQGTYRAAYESIFELEQKHHEVVRLMTQMIVGWMWPQYCNVQSVEVLELPELGDVV